MRDIGLRSFLLRDAHSRAHPCLSKKNLELEVMTTPDKHISHSCALYNRTCVSYGVYWHRRCGVSDISSRSEPVLGGCMDSSGRNPKSDWIVSGFRWASPILDENLGLRVPKTGAFSHWHRGPSFGNVRRPPIAEGDFEFPVYVDPVTSPRDSYFGRHAHLRLPEGNAPYQMTTIVCAEDCRSYHTQQERLSFGFSNHGSLNRLPLSVNSDRSGDR